jgi:hypothetical protein
MAKQITELTRRDIFDYILVEKIIWNGRLEEADFLARIFDIKDMESYDSRFQNTYGDIWQHRVNNYDWEDDWIFRDDRFDLMSCDDSLLLQFLCEMIHPVVRTDRQEIVRLTQAFNELLRPDGFEIVPKSQISGRPVFAGRRIFLADQGIKNRNDIIKRELSAEYISQQINLMESSIDAAPHVAIGTAKELIETCCKTVLEGRNKEVDENWNITRLVKATTDELELSPASVSDEKKASQTIKRILGSLSSVIQGIAELRNDYGSGHGKDGNFVGLGPRHARLAVGAASTLAAFLLETHNVKQPQKEIS